MSIWSREIEAHFATSEEREQLEKIEQQIVHEYNELKGDIEDNDLRYNLTFTRPFSSHLIPKDPGHLSRERRLYLERFAHVPTIDDVQMLDEQFRDELETCSASNSDFTSESFPLLIMNFYLKRLSSLTFAKTLHSVRWKRFSRQQNDFDQAERSFIERSARIQAEFNDALKRAQRLSIIRESLMSPNTPSAKNPSQPLVNDDHIPYVRYLICHYRGEKLFDQLKQLIRSFHFKFRTQQSNETQTATINFRTATSPFQNTTALLKIPTIEIEQKSTLDKLNELFRVFSLPLDITKVRTGADEMELYAQIVRHYRILFSRQEKERPVHFYEPTAIQFNTEKRKTPEHTLIKKSPWIDYFNIKPERDAQRERDLSRYIQNGKADELLLRISDFLQVRQVDKAANVLKQYLLALKTKRNAALQQILDSTTTNPMQATAMTDLFWKNVFDFNAGENLSDDDEEDFDQDKNEQIDSSFGISEKSNRSSRYMKRDEFNYLETLQKLGLDDASAQRNDSDNENDDVSESYGLQLSYITLRFLRLRTLRHRCLHELNYFRSIQRTLTIYEHRLLMTNKEKNLQPIDQRFSDFVQHVYLFDTPIECSLETLNFMQTGEHIENVEDFASETLTENDGPTVRVRDSLGLYIVYDSALKDIQELEQEIIAIGSFFIDKALLKQTKNVNNQMFNRKIDRFEILYNLWENEWNFLLWKRRIVDCFYEIYQHTFDPVQRHLISQTIVDFMAKRPRIDFSTDDYFLHSYSLEIRWMTIYFNLIRTFIDRHVNDMRQVTENLIDSSDFGSFLPATRSLASPPIYLSPSKIHSYYLFEFLESLSCLTRLPGLIKQSFDELIHLQQFQVEKSLSLTDEILYQLEYFEEISNRFQQIDQIGSSFPVQYQRDFFNTLFTEHPTMMGNFAYEILKQVDESRTTKKEQYEKFVKLATNLIELLTLRFRLIRSASESEILSNVYKQQLDVMSIDQSHLFLRVVQFEFAQGRNFSSNEQDYDHEPSQIPDGRLDKITGQQHLLFSIQEFEEGNIGRFNFRQKEQWQTMINESDDTINNLKLVLRLQLLHNQLLRTAIIQHRFSIICITQELERSRTGNTVEQTKSMNNSKRSTSALSETSEQSNTLLNNVILETTRRKMFRETYFISIQFEKTPLRDQMLSEFIRKRDLKPLVYQQPREAEKLKRTLLNHFIDQIHQRNSIILLRLQIIQSYLSISHLIQKFPLTSRSHFMWPKKTQIKLSNTLSGIQTSTNTTGQTGETHDSKSSTPLLTDVLTPNGYRSRPRSFLNENQTDLSNLWYLPSFHEQFHLFKNKQITRDEYQKRLRCVLRIVSSFNDLIHIVVAFAQLNSANNHPEQRFLDRSEDLLSFDQSGEFASELHEIQREIDNLPSLGLDQVADLLETKRRLTIFQIFYTIVYLVPNRFLTNQNEIAFDHVRSRVQPIIQHFLNSYYKYHPNYSILPQPILPLQPIAKEFYPWTLHEYLYNIKSKSLWLPQNNLIDLIQLPLFGLKATELPVANAEYMITQVMLQNIDDIVKMKTIQTDGTRILRHKQVSNQEYLSRYLRLELYLIECIRLEKVRDGWSKAKLNVSAIDNLKTFEDSFVCFRDEILSPVLRQLSTAVGYSSFYSDYPQALVNGQLAPNVTDFECKRALVMRLLVELEGKFMMNDTLKRLKRERTLVISERSREENSLPTDLWKKQIFTENFSITRPHILDEFSMILAEHEIKDQQDSSDKFCIRREDLETCLKNLGSHLMKREHENYTNYSTYYENILYNARQTISLRDQEISGCRSQLREHQSNLELECQLLTLSAYFDLISELVHLRMLNNQILIDKNFQFNKELNKIRERFQSVCEQLLNSNLFLRTRFEQFREQLYRSTIEIVKDVRNEVSRLARTKLTSDARAIVDQQQNEQSKLIASLQDEIHENHQQKIDELSQREQQWRREQVNMEKTIDELHYQLDRYKKRFVYQTRKQVEEIQSLKKVNNYLRKRILFNENQYKKMREAESKSESRANMERNDSLRQALNQKQIIETKLRYIQEKNERLAIKDMQLERKTHEYERENQAMRLHQTYVQRDLSQTKKKLEQERALKYDAFQQVEVLRTNLNEIEEELEQAILNDTNASLVSNSTVPPPSRALVSARTITPYQYILTRNRPMTSAPGLQRDKTRLNSSRLRSSSTTPIPIKRPPTSNVHIEQITPLTEELLNNLGASNSPVTSSNKILRIRSAKT